MTGFSKEIDEAIANFCLMDDGYMTKFFENNISGAELLLQIILQDATIKVVEVATQKLYKNLSGHDVWLDIVAKKQDGTLFNVEIQNKSKGAPPQRARYHASMLDANSLPKGKYYNKLPENYVIFITAKDVLKRGLPLYHIQRTILEDGTSFGDGSHIVYVNGKIKDTTPLGRLMHDFCCKKPEDMYYNVLAERAMYFKRSKEGKNKMGDVMGKLMGKLLKKQRIEFAKSLLAEGMSVEFIVRNTKLSAKEVRKLAEKQSA